jgi:hypothetical protein
MPYDIKSTVMPQKDISSGGYEYYSTALSRHPLPLFNTGPGLAIKTPAQKTLLNKTPKSFAQ